jgi:hypothetical protein
MVFGRWRYNLITRDFPVFGGNPASRNTSFGYEQAKKGPDPSTLSVNEAFATLTRK